MKSFLVTLKALSPISHGSFGASTGNALMFRRIPVVNLPGKPRIPAVSGNALRGVLRRLVFRDLFSRLGLGRETPGWGNLYASLANGGHLQGSEPSLDPAMIANLRAALPPLSVFGSSLRTWLLEGRVDVGICWPRCAETLAAGLVAPSVQETLSPAEDLVHDYAHTRHVDRDEHDPGETGVTPMPTTVETLATGTVLESRIIARSKATDAELGALGHGLDVLHTIGGKSAAGLGRVEILHDIDPAPYRAWLEGLDGIREAVLELAERLEKAGEKKARKEKEKQDASAEAHG